MARFEEGRLIFHVRDTDGRVRAEVPFTYEFVGLFVGSVALTEQHGSPAVVRHETDWLELERSDLLTERYEVLESGLEQIFILYRKPDPLEGDLEIRGMLDTPLRAELEEPGAGQPIVFLDGTEPVVRVGRVLVRDADGRELLGRLQVSDDRLSIVLDGEWLAEASYPVEVDPLIGSAISVNAGRIAFSPDVSYNALDNQYLVVWKQQNLSTDDDIWGALLDGQGNPVNSGFAVRWSFGDQQAPTVSWASLTNRWLVCWQHDNVFHWDIQCRVLVPNGSGVAYGDVFRVYDNIYHQNFPDVACGETECVVVFQHDYPLADFDVLGARVNTATEQYLGAFGISRNVGRDETRPVVAFRPAPYNEYMVAFEIDGSASQDIDAVVLDSGGTVLGRCDVAQQPESEGYPDIAFSEHAQRYLIAWQRGADLYGQVQNPDCTAHVEDFLVRHDVAAVIDPRIAGGSPDDCFAVASQVDHVGQSNVLLQTVCDDGSVPETLTLPIEVLDRGSLGLSYNENEEMHNEYLLVWADPGGDPVIGAQRYATTLCADEDNDGYAVCDGVCKLDPEPQDTCGDCDDSDGEVNPGAWEQCDGKDNDCDGEVPPDEIDDDEDGWSECEGDCDDTNSRVLPVRTEVCHDGIDNNCDGLTDCFDPDCDDDPSCDCIDFDLDNYVDCTGGCKPEPGQKCGECDDFNPDVHPYAAEDCENGFDDNCNGRTDAEDPACSPVCPDQDGDGWVVCDAGCVPDIGLECGDCDEGASNVNPGMPEDCQGGGDEDCDGFVNINDPDCTACPDADEDGWAVCAPDCALDVGDMCGDCEDLDEEINPAAPERCNGFDDDCDGTIPNDESDADEDLWRICDGDCDDDDPNTYPGGGDLCDGKDNDCDGTLQEDEADLDGDGIAWCEGDCEDTEPTIYPGAPEICDGFDNDCSGALPPNETDDDNDHYTECEGDCDDTDGTIHPGQTETWFMCGDRKDNDCDGFPDCWDSGCSDWSTCVCRDGDNDGWIDCTNGCTPESPDLLCGDCSEGDPDVNPGRPEDCWSGRDDDCDGLIDGDDPDCWPPCNDYDNDNWADCQSPCVPEAGDQCGDCRDNDADIHPGAPDDTCDFQDNDCDGISDEDALPPGGSITLEVSRSGLSWSAVPDASGYQLIGGEVEMLRQTAGDFEQATTACLTEDAPGTSFTDPFAPPPGEGAWYLVSARNCAGLGGFDSGGSGQPVSRDAGIAASQVCP